MRLVLPGEEFLMGLDGSENFPGFATRENPGQKPMKSMKINEKSMDFFDFPMVKSHFSSGNNVLGKLFFDKNKTVLINTNLNKYVFTISFARRSVSVGFGRVRKIPRFRNVDFFENPGKRRKSIKNHQKSMKIR